jgi:integral membrane sensor domain MASE1
VYQDNLKYLAGITAFTVVYFAAAKFGLWLAPLDYVTPLWPPTGIALAVILIFGYRYWPAILIGALAVSASTNVPLKTVLGIGVGDSLEALLGACLLQRVARFQQALDRLWDVLGFVALAALFATTVGAMMGVASLWWGEVLDPSQGIPIWWTW